MLALRRRVWTVRQGYRPVWPFSPLGRIRSSWRLVEVALGDLGAPARPNEAADIRDRVSYGWGIGRQDVVLMQRVAVWVYRIVWDRQTDWAQIKAMYRSLG